MLTAAGLVAIFLVLDISIPLSCSTTGFTNSTSIIKTCNSVKTLSYSLSEGLALFVFGALLLYIIHLHELPNKGWSGMIVKGIATVLTSAGFSVLLVTLFVYGQAGLGITQLSVVTLYLLYGLLTLLIYFFLEYGERFVSRIERQKNFEEGD